MNQFQESFQESFPTDSQLSHDSFLPRYARGGDRKQETGGNKACVAFPTNSGAPNSEAPAQPTDPAERQCEQCIALKAQLRGARLALTVVRDALAAERADR